MENSSDHIICNNLFELKEFVNSLTVEQLQQPIRISQEDLPTVEVNTVEILKCDHINPSGDYVEPITAFF